MFNTRKEHRLVLEWEDITSKRILTHLDLMVTPFELKGVMFYNQETLNIKSAQPQKIKDVTNK